MDEKTLEIRAVEFTGSDIGDATMLPEPLDQIPPAQEIGSVTADGAYDTRKCHNAIADGGANAVIPPRKNAKPWKPDTVAAITGTLAKMERIPPPKSHRDEDALLETAGPMANGTAT